MYMRTASGSFVDVSAVVFPGVVVPLRLPCPCPDTMERIAVTTPARELVECEFLFFS